ncbi:hypothetical protein [Maricaulis sp. CAU 1757]
MLLFMVGLGAEAVSAASPGHDHHVLNGEVIEQQAPKVSGDDADTSNDYEQSEHGRHALHGCGVCHHAIGFGLAVTSPYQRQLPVRFPPIDDRMRSRSPEPPFTPPIAVSV